MNCEKFKENMVDLFDRETENQDLLKHIESCGDCRKYYEEWVMVVGALTPRHAPELKAYVKPEPAVRENCHAPQDNMEKKTQLKPKTKPKLFLRSWSQMAAAVFIFLLGIGFGMSNFFSSNAVASDAARLLDRSLSGIKNVRNFSMELQVRTGLNESFDYIAADDPFIEHRLGVAYADGQTLWRLEKKDGRTLVSDGQKQYLWREGNPKAIIFPLSTNLCGYFTPLINPDVLFEYEKRMIEESDTDSYTVKSTGSATILTIHSICKGNPDPMFWRDHSIVESDNIREYVFEKKSGLLTGLKYWLVIGGQKILFLKSDRILYDTESDPAVITRIPAEGYEWIDNTKKTHIDPVRLALLQQESAEQAATRILSAIFDGNTHDAREALIYYDTNGLIETWSTYQLIECVETLRSDGYSGTYAIVDVLTPKKKKKKVTLALRNDNPDIIWMLDGGL